MRRGRAHSMASSSRDSHGGQVGMQELEGLFERVIHAVYDLGREKGDGWASWHQVAVRAQGSAEYRDLCSAIAEQRAYSQYFISNRRGTHVRLSEEGLCFVNETSARPARDPYAPRSVANAIIGYAAKLHNTHLKIEDVAIVSHVGDKVVQAVRVEMWDGQATPGTPVTVKSQGRGAWTHGRVVGQDTDASRIYVAFDTEVGPEHLPALLMFDRGFLLKQLADQVVSMPAMPIHAAALFAEGMATGIGLGVQNAEQAAAYLAELEEEWSRVMWGPPGAGKTYAIAQFVARKLGSDPGARILLLAPSNLAADVLVEEVVVALQRAGLADLLAGRQVLRYGYAVKDSILSRPELLGPESAAGLAASIKRIGQRLARAERKQEKESVVAQLRAELLATQAELAAMIREHAEGAAVVATTAASAYLPKNPIAALRPDYVVVDEATMVPPAFCYFLASLARSGFLIAGDPRQLGPVVEPTGLLSDLERQWLERDVFEAAAISAGSGEQRALSLENPRLLRIEEQRRCPPSIWELVGHLYPGVRCSVPAPAAPMADGLAEHGVMLLDTGGLASSPCMPIGKSWCNQQSASLAIEVATSAAGDASDETVAIISPYRAQVRLLTSLLRQEQSVSNLAGRIAVGTVHQFQGSAADTVILDLVDGPSRRRLGMLLADDTGMRLVNVAITRARKRLIVLADQHWVQQRCNRDANPLLWDLVVERPAAETMAVLSEDERAEAVPYESAYEAMLGEAMRAEVSLESVVPQYRICRQDGSLISRADFAVPELQYAVYVDGAAWHLTPSGWQRDRRLRTELRELGWKVSVFSADEVRSDPARSVAEVVRRVAELEAAARVVPQNM